MKRIVRNKFNHPYTLHNSAEWIQSGNKIFERYIGLIDLARQEIHLQVYILASDKTGNPVIEALIRAARRNVEVFLLVDAYGSQKLSSESISGMKAAGIHFKKYGKLFSNGNLHIGRRMHHKVFVVDGHTSIVGGINISDNYNDVDGNKAWLDFAVILQGDISARLLFICRHRWLGWKFSYKSRKELLKKNDAGGNISGNVLIRTRRNDFARNKNDIAISYREALRSAEKTILIVGGYFLPGGRTRRLMKLAILRGVKIDVVFSENSDVGILVYARQYLYAWLIRNSVGVFKYNPSNVHGKVIIIDGKWTSIGSYDLNNLSTYSNIELNVDIKDADFSASLSKHIHTIMTNDCDKLTGKNMYKYKNIFSRFRMWLSYRFVKTLFVLSFLLAGKKEKEF